jgi:DNA-binding transcriptional MerR regulator
LKPIQNEEEAIFYDTVTNNQDNEVVKTESLALGAFVVGKSKKASDNVRFHNRLGGQTSKFASFENVSYQETPSEIKRAPEVSPKAPSQKGSGTQTYDPPHTTIDDFILWLKEKHISAEDTVKIMESLQKGSPEFDQFIANVFSDKEQQMMDLKNQNELLKEEPMTWAKEQFELFKAQAVDEVDKAFKEQKANFDRYVDNLRASTIHEIEEKGTQTAPDGSKVPTSFSQEDSVNSPLIRNVETSGGGAVEAMEDIINTHLVNIDPTDSPQMGDILIYEQIRDSIDFTSQDHMELCAKALVNFATLTIGKEGSMPPQNYMNLLRDLDYFLGNARQNIDYSNEGSRLANNIKKAGFVAEHQRFLNMVAKEMLPGGKDYEALGKRPSGKRKRRKRT